MHLLGRGTSGRKSNKKHQQSQTDYTSLPPPYPTPRQSLSFYTPLRHAEASCLFLFDLH
ncbi:hypothetical protein CGRA01v4_02942 [Colletotrichum graminicola]|nr:hypothetical protein CGRA01v4_02942 [Colletotrichum graminicola]